VSHHRGADAASAEHVGEEDQVDEAEAERACSWLYRFKPPSIVAIASALGASVSVRTAALT